MANIDKQMKNVGKRFAESNIQNFYSGKTIFLTGGTGYMGKCLVEKLLRGCPDLKRIYLLVREKKGASAEDRIKDYFDDVLFDTLRKTKMDFQSKIRMIKGDLVQADVALSEEDKNTIIEEVNIIFHNASNVKFHERMSTALKINVLGTQAILDLAKRCKNVEGFMYVSTAYSHCYQSDIMEQTYQSPATMKMVEDLISADLVGPTGLTDVELRSTLDKYPNTYCYTKAIAEGLVDDAGKQVSFPCIINRPSVVISSWKEPVRGWCESLNGPAVVFSGFGIGVVHTGLLGDRPLDMIPVDMSINAILVSMWDAVKKRQSVSGALVYNYGSSVEKPISVKRFHRMCMPYVNENPSIHTIWKPFVVFTPCFWYFAILYTLFHFFPAVIYDAYLLVTGNKTRAVSALKRVNKHFSALLYFKTHVWKINIAVMNEAIDQLNTTDQELFFCDVRKLDWKDYCSTYWDGLRLYILKDPMSTLPAARRKLQNLKIVHFITKYAIMLLIAYVTARLVGLL